MFLPGPSQTKSANIWVRRTPLLILGYPPHPTGSVGRGSRDLCVSFVHINKRITRFSTVNHKKCLTPCLTRKRSKTVSYLLSASFMQDTSFHCCVRANEIATSVGQNGSTSAPLYASRSLSSLLLRKSASLGWVGPVAPGRGIIRALGSLEQ